MSILVNRRSRVITQGMTHKAGRFHTGKCREYGKGRKCFVGAVDPTNAGDRVDDLPVFGSVREARKHTGATVSVIYVPPADVAAAITEAMDAELDLVICVTDGVPVDDMLRLRHRIRDSKTLLLGPDCAGLITPGDISIGILPGHIHRPGRIGVVSRSGTLADEAARQLAAVGLGQSTVVCVGADPLDGLQHLELLKLFNDDPGTDAILMVGEIGAEGEETCARWIREHMRKPLVGFIADRAAPEGNPLAQAGAIVSACNGAARERFALMEDCGIHLTRNPAGLGALMASVAPSPFLPFD